MFAFLFFLVSALSVAAQDSAAPATNAGPLQIQEQPAPGTMPAPSLFGGDQGAPAASPVPADSNAPAAVSSPAETNVPGAAPVGSDSNAPAANSGLGSPGQNPPPSDPNSLIPPPAEPEQPSPVNASGNEAKQREDQKTRYYTAKTKADKEDSLSSLQAKADRAKSDEAKRQALREYYDLLAKRMKKIDPSISDWIDTMHAAYLRRLTQVRVEPTIPVNPPPAADASPTPVSEKKKKNRKDEAEPAATPAATPSSEKKKAKPEPKADASPSPSPSRQKKKSADAHATAGSSPASSVKSSQ